MCKGVWEVGEWSAVFGVVAAEAVAVSGEGFLLCFVEDAGLGVLLSGEVCHLLFELEVVFEPFGFESAFGDGGEDGAARLGAVVAVPELALEGEGFDVGEFGGETFAFAPELDFAHARGGDDDASGVEEDHLAPGGGVSTFTVAWADLGGECEVLSCESVDEEGFSDARTSEKDGGFSGAEEGSQRVEAEVEECADGVNWDARGGRFDLEDALVRFGTEVGLVEEDDGHGATLPGEGDVTLDGGEVEVTSAIESADEEGDVDVGSDDLLFGEGTGLVTRDSASTREYGVDGGAGFGGEGSDGDPVTDGGEFGARDGVVTCASGELGVEPAELAVEDETVAFLACDARGGEALGSEGLEVGFEKGAPAEPGEGDAVRGLRMG